MKEQEYRKIMVKLSEFAKLVQDAEIDVEALQMDKQYLFWKIREISGILQDINRATDLRDNPMKVEAVYTPKAKDATPS